MSSCCSSPSTQANCGSSHSDTSNVNVVWKLGTALAIAGLTMMFGLGTNISPIDAFTQEYWIVHGGMIAGSCTVLLLLGWPLVKGTFKALIKGRLTIEGLFLVGVMGALIGSLLSTFKGHGDVYYEVIAVVLAIYTTGQLITSQSRSKAMAEVHKLRETFGIAYIHAKDGTRIPTPVSSIKVGDIVSVGPGEPITIDGIISQGESYIKETALTGEINPVSKSEGDSVMAGSYTIDGTLSIKSTAIAGERQIDQLLQAIEHAEIQPSRWQDQANQIMQWFLPFVILISVGTFLGWYFFRPWDIALFNSMAVLLIACPCALGLATPIAIWSGLWKLSQMGLVARSGDFLNSLAQTTQLVFDKTGTLSEEQLTLSHWFFSSRYKGEDIKIKTLIHVIEQPIDHPLARAFVNDNIAVTEKWEILRSRIVPGKGIEAQVQKENEASIAVRIGEKDFMCHTTQTDFAVLEGDNDAYGSKKVVYISINDQAAAIVTFDEKLRENTQEVFTSLKELNIQTSILTGDTNPHWEQIEGIQVEAGLSPEGKLKKIHEYKNKGNQLLFIGDGINDAPAMAECQASIAMGSGASLTQSTATAVLKGNSLDTLPKAIRLAKKIRKSIRGNLLFAASYNLLGMGLAAAGKLHPVVAALIMLVSSVIVSVRAVRSAQ